MDAIWATLQRIFGMEGQDRLQEKQVYCIHALLTNAKEISWTSLKETDELVSTEADNDHVTIGVRSHYKSPRRGDEILDTLKVCDLSAAKNIQPWSDLQWKVAFSPDGFYASYGGKSVSVGCPSDLAHILHQEGADDILSIAVGPRDEYFLRTRSMIYSVGLSATLVSEHRTALIAFGANSQWIALLNSDRSYDKDRYEIVYNSTWDSPRVPNPLRKVLDSGADWKVKTLSLGPDSSWAMTYRDGGWAASGIDPCLHDKLQSAGAGDIKNIVLSYHDKHTWFVELANGGYVRRFSKASWAKAFDRLG